jgi:hypothetical protein
MLYSFIIISELEHARQQKSWKLKKMKKKKKKKRFDRQQSLFISQAERGCTECWKTITL